MHHLTALSCRQPEGLQLKGQLIGEGEGPEAARLLRSPWLHQSRLPPVLALQ